MYAAIIGVINCNAPRFKISEEYEDDKVIAECNAAICTNGTVSVIRSNTIFMVSVGFGIVGIFAIAMQASSRTVGSLDRSYINITLVRRSSFSKSDCSAFKGSNLWDLSREGRDFTIYLI